MIVRNQESDSAICIPQLHHSLMTGELASAWNTGFSRSFSAFDKVKKAALLHDLGWLDWEAVPEINPESHHPYDFLEMPKTAHLDIWKNGLLDTVVLDPLIGLLVLRHNMALAQKDADEDASVQEFMDKMQKEDQKLEKHVLDSGMVENKAELKRMNAFIMLTDYISLRMVMGASKDNPFGGSAPSFDGIEYELKQVDDLPETMSLSPWPFVGERFEWKATGWIHHKGEVFEKLPASSKKEITMSLVPG